MYFTNRDHNFAEIVQKWSTSSKLQTRFHKSFKVLWCILNTNDDFIFFQGLHNFIFGPLSVEIKHYIRKNDITNYVAIIG